LGTQTSRQEKYPMNLKQHLLTTGAAAAAMTPFCPIDGVLLFAAGGILIDVDHQIFYYERTGRHDITGMFRYFKEVVDMNLYAIPYLGICIFHTIEFLLAVAVISLYLPLVRYLLAGFVFHIILDIYDLIRLKVPFIRAYSFIEHLIRRRQQGYPFT
jgi:hypothetical protein